VIEASRGVRAAKARIGKTIEFGGKKTWCRWARAPILVSSLSSIRVGPAYGKEEIEERVEGTLRFYGKGREKESNQYERYLRH